jgi:hypothetical protein
MVFLLFPKMTILNFEIDNIDTFPDIIFSFIRILDLFWIIENIKDIKMSMWHFSLIFTLLIIFKLHFSILNVCSILTESISFNVPITVSQLIPS